MGEQRLLLVQIDDRSGEELRQGLEGLMDMGVRNYQVLSSLTKKGRPGFVLLLDLDSAIEGEVMTYLAAELGAWGYHRLQSVHEHFDVASGDARSHVRLRRTSRAVHRLLQGAASRRPSVPREDGAA